MARIKTNNDGKNRMYKQDGMIDASLVAHKATMGRGDADHKPDSCRHMHGCQRTI
jgi:hypothetical protein